MCLVRVHYNKNIKKDWLSCVVKTRPISCNTNGKKSSHCEHSLASKQGIQKHFNRRHISSNLLSWHEFMEAWPLISPYSRDEKKMFMSRIMNWINWTFIIIQMRPRSKNYGLWKIVYGKFMLEKWYINSDKYIWISIVLLAEILS